VLAATGTVTGSYLTMTSYAADGTANANLQRWTFEMVVLTDYGYIYLVRNVASGLCMTPNASFGMYLQPCNLSGSWLLQATGAVAGTGYWLRAFSSGKLGLCLNADAHPSTNPTRVNPDSCYPSNPTGERWRVRPGKDACTTLDVTSVCSSFTPPGVGIFGNWRQSEVSFTGSKNAEVSEYAGGKTVNGQLVDAIADWFEIGWRATHNIGNGTTPPTIVEEAYWQETAPGFNEYHSLRGAPGGSTGDGRNHTYMALSSSTGKVDILYDYNTVGTTIMSEGSRLNYLETGITKRDETTAILPSGIEHRVQEQDPNGLWHRLVAATTTQVNDRQCYGPSTTQPSNPPNCINVTTVTIPGTSGMSEIDHVAFTQPAAALSDRTGEGSMPRPDRGPEVLNGVDQRHLNVCMDNAPTTCLQTVPGLAACVSARLRCSAAGSTTASDIRPSGPKAMSAAQAKTAARDELLIKNGLALPSKTSLAVHTFPARPLDATRRWPRSHADDDSYLVVTGSDIVSGSKHDRRHMQSYHGFALTYRASTGALVDICLGAGCENR
jgi:hypothetical protein